MCPPTRKFYKFWCPEFLLKFRYVGMTELAELNLQCPSKPQLFSDMDGFLVTIPQMILNHPIS